jgi:hypothetical protein
VRDLQPVPANQNQPNQSTPTITTVTIPGTVITSTIYTTITTTVTSTVETVVTRTATATITTVAVVTVTAEVSTTPTTVTTAIAVPAPDTALAMEKSRILVLIAETIKSLEQLKQRDPTRRDIDYAIANLKKLREQVEKTTSLPELKSIENRVRDIASRFQVSTKEKVDARFVANQIANIYSMLAQEVKDENVKKVLQQVADVYSYLSNTDLNALRRDVALFYMLMDLARDDVYKQIYEGRKDSFQSLLRILSNNATYSDVEKAFEALAIIKQLKDQGMLSEKQVLDHYRYAVIVGKGYTATLQSYLAPGTSLVQFIQMLMQMYGGEIDKDVQQRFRDVESKISSGVEPEKRVLPIQLIAEATALINPTRYIYNLAFNGVKSLAKMLGADENTASSIAGKVATGVTSASASATGVLVPPLGMAIALSATLDAISDIASRLTSPIEKQLFLSYLQSHWQDLLVNTAIGVASGLATGYTTAKLKPTIYNKVADVLEKLGAKDLAKKVRMVTGAPAEGGRGVVEAKVREVPEEVSVDYSYDQATGKMRLMIKLGGKVEVIDVDVPKELANKFKAYARTETHVAKAPEGIEISKAFEAVFKLIYKTVKDRDKALQMFKDFTKRVGVGDDVAVQTLIEASKSNIVGDVRLKIWSRSSTIYDNAKGLCKYIEKGGKVWQIVGANDEASSIIRGLVMYDDEASMSMLIGKQAYLYTKTGEGTFLNTVMIEKYMPRNVFLALVEDLKKLFNAIKANIEVLKQIRMHPEGGGLSFERVAQLLRIELGPDTASALRSDPVLRNYIEIALMNILRGVDVYPIFVYNPSTSFVRASLLIPTTVANTVLQNMVERGVIPANLRVVPTHRYEVATAVATRTVENVARITTTVFTGITRATRLGEVAVYRKDVVPEVVTRTVEVVNTLTVVQPTALTKQIQFKEVPIHRVETAPVIVTNTVEAVSTRVVTYPTAITKTQQLIEKPVHRIDTVPMIITKTVEVIVPQTVVQPTALVKQETLSETAIHRTSTELFLVTSSTTVVVVTTTTITGTVVETGTVSIVTIPVVITYTYTIPITVAGVAPTQTTPATPTETAKVVAKPRLPRLPGVEGAGIVPVAAKPEKKPKLEKEVLVI